MHSLRFSSTSQDYDRATRFLERSIRLFPTADAERNLQFAHSRRHNNTTNSNANSDNIYSALQYAWSTIKEGRNPIHPSFRSQLAVLLIALIVCVWWKYDNDSVIDTYPHRPSPSSSSRKYQALDDHYYYQTSSISMWSSLLLSVGLTILLNMFSGRGFISFPRWRP